MSSRYQTKHHYPDLSISTRTWKRLVPHFSHSVAEIVTEIEAERGNTGNHFSKASRVNSVLAHNAIRAAPLYELYASNHETYLSAMHGMGDVARLSVPAALLRFAGYDDLLPDVESFEEAAAIRFTDKTRRK